MFIRKLVSISERSLGIIIIMKLVHKVHKQTERHTNGQTDRQRMNTN